MDPLSKLVASQTSLNRLVKQLSAQQALTQKIRQLLPAPLDAQLKTVVLQQGRLALFVSSPVWANRLRYLLPKLQMQLKNKGIHSTELHTNIIPDVSTKPTKTLKPNRPTLSQAAGSQIQETAKTISDPSLRAALERLGRHAKQS
jgi:hypothetical protein